ncbi:bifunctional nucleoside/nucleotide kinase/histidine phosphatase family protein [Desulfovibrio inopinatus]|uniref:bifunctional nucleoside/nucleotide kinase/histidine phosphatase family protein n=1 Tax=Desulfovibrio inopinatus TaxID=102109 RepID=UPI0003FF59DD|nr:6-phosphofructo-2-kinase/fructose-2,6-bisphosphatase [Desulfovibrio inopinatus]
MDKKLYIVMVGLPARGKTTVAAKIKENLEKENIRVRIFNNGDVRRRMLQENTSHAGFYNPSNIEGHSVREKIAMINIEEARHYLSSRGQIAILDATNASAKRRQTLREHLTDHPIIFVECINEDRELLQASIIRKTKMAEFAHLTFDEAYRSFEERISYYESIYSPLSHKDNSITIDTLNNRIIRENVGVVIPYYPRIRDLLVSDWVKNLFLVRHGQTHYNLDMRLGGNSELTETGHAQARALADHFKGTPIPYIFTSTKIRTKQMGTPISADQSGHCTVISLPEFDEIDAGVCEHMTYQEILEQMPEAYAARSRDKYNFIYEKGEGYVTLKDRVYRGIKKALYLSGNSDNIMVIGHQAVNRMILSHFLFRRTEDVPYIYIPQDKYFHITSTQTRKVFELKSFLADRCFSCPL